MTNIDNFDEVKRVLAKHIPLNTKKGSYSLDRIQKLMDALGNPQESYKVIHVAGTSGKTSTCYYLSSLLIQTGKKVGMTVSPHIDEVNERAQINLTPLPEKKFCSELAEFIKILNKLSIKPTYFELLIAFAYWEFAKQKVDYAVVEVGLGGLLDGTNVIKRPDKVCVITDIGLDHTNVLGGDVCKIAAQKAGIIQSGNEVFCFKQGDEIMQVVRKVCQDKEAELHEITEVHSETTSKLPLFQQRNWQLAQKTVEYVVARDDLKPLTHIQLIDSTKTLVPARMEIIQLGSKTIILDGAHNPQKISMLVKSLQEKFPAQKMSVLLGLLSDKDLGGVLKEIAKVSSSITATTFKAEQDMPRGSIGADDIVEAGKALGFANISANALPEDAMKDLLEKKDEIILVVGSFFLLNHIRPLVLAEKSA